MYLKLAVPTPLRRSFDYLAPDEADPALLTPGMRIPVDFANRKVIGILLETSRQTVLDSSKIKTAGNPLDRTPAITGPLLDLCLWAASYYQHPIGEVLANALPAALRKSNKTIAPSRQTLILTSVGQAMELANLARAPKQKQLLQLLQEQQSVTKDELARKRLQQSTKALLAKGFVQWQVAGDALSHSDAVQTSPAPAPLKEPHLNLNREQQQVLSFLQALENPRVVLLEGITGSGKTEVYLQFIAGILAQGKQALVLVPEIGLTPQTVERFSNRFDVPIHVLHSRLNESQRLQAWLAARSGQASIIIGTRSAIFTPMKFPGVIIVDEEHDGSFKQQDGFRYSARDLAVKRGSLDKIPVVLGSATPSFESLHNVNRGRYSHCRLTERAGGASTPAFHLLNIRNRRLKGGLSAPLIDEITHHLDNNNQVLVFLNRRGYAPTLLCRSCGWIANCRRCDARMTLHKSANNLQCHHCDFKLSIPEKCPECSAATLAQLGLGTERTESALRKEFSDHVLIRVDRDTTRRRFSLEKLLDKIRQSGPAILIGTQMLAKGHHFPNVSLVAVVDADSGFFSSDFRAIEKMAQLLLQVAGRAGRERTAGKVVIQTHFPDHPILQTLLREGYSPFAKKCLTQRSKAQLPPYTHLAIVRAEAINQKAPLLFLRSVRRSAVSLSSELFIRDVRVLGPIPSAMERRAGRFRAQLLVSSSNRANLQRLLEKLASQIESDKLARTVRWSLDVDPTEMY